MSFSSSLSSSLLSSLSSSLFAGLLSSRLLCSESVEKKLRLFSGHVRRTKDSRGSIYKISIYLLSKYLSGLVEGINNKRTTKEKTGCQQDDGEQNGVT